MAYKFEDLNCWKSAFEFNIEALTILDQKKINNHRALEDQLSRASLSIMNNIAEGYGRYGKKDKIKFLNISQASCCEVKSMLYLIERMNYITKEEFQSLYSKLESTQKLILGFIRYLNKKDNIQNTPDH